MASVHEHPNSNYWQASFAAWDEDRGWIRKSASTRVPLSEPKAKAQIVADRLEEFAAKLAPQKNSPAIQPAREYFAQLIDELCVMAGGTSNQSLTWAKWRHLWLSEFDVTEGTMRSYIDSLNLWEEFWKNPGGSLLDISFERAQEYYNWLRGIKITANTARLRWDTFRRCLERARVMGYIRINPAAQVKAGFKSTGVVELERAPFTPAEARALIQHAQGEWKTACLFGFLYGMRISDATGRRWDEIQDDCIIFAQTKKRGRLIKLPLVPLMKEHLATLPRVDPLITPHLGSIRHNSQTKAFHRLMKEAGVKIQKEPGSGRGMTRYDKSFHSWRHTNKTLLIAAGVSERIADMINDHETPEIGKRYTHADMDTMAAALAKLPEV